MNETRLALFAVLVTVTALWAPVSLQAATPVRLVGLTELTARPEEVAISTTHLTLIHFEIGDVSMVAVGDPALVSVTVKGPDVLLKALVSSGSTNAFIWQGGRYTQWTLVVRKDSNDARLVIVKDAGAPLREDSTRTSRERGKQDGKQPVGPTAVAIPPGELSVTAPAASMAAAPEAVVQPDPAPTPLETTTTQMPRSTCGKPAMLDQFVKTLTARQRDLFGVFLTEPSFATLQRLMAELNLPQRCDLLAVLWVGASLAPATPLARPPAPAPPREDDRERSPSPPRPAENPPAPPAPVVLGKYRP